jgi:hypothetical protein
MLAVALLPHLMESLSRIIKGGVPYALRRASFDSEELKALAENFVKIFRQSLHSSIVEVPNRSIEIFVEDNFEKIIVDKE